VVELYEEFVKFSKSEVLHFRKLEKQRKAPNQDETLRPTRYSDNQRSYLSKCTTSTLMAVDHQRIGKKIWTTSAREKPKNLRAKDQTTIIREEECQAEATVVAKAHTHSSHRTACTMAATLTAAIFVYRRLPHNQYSPSYPFLFPPQTYQNNQAQALAYYQSYHYTTTNHPQPPPTL
jgi:hypothetical protein